MTSYKKVARITDYSNTAGNPQYRIILPKEAIDYIGRDVTIYDIGNHIEIRTKGIGMLGKIVSEVDRRIAYKPGSNFGTLTLSASLVSKYKIYKEAILEFDTLLARSLVVIPLDKSGEPVGTYIPQEPVTRDEVVDQVADEYDAIIADIRSSRREEKYALRRTPFERAGGRI